ncbi:MAG: LpqB family beta-propeller domain-containing protein [Mycobacteriales bacterium]
MRRRAALAGLLLVAGCSLPLPTGVHTPSGVTGEQPPADLQVLPQGPTRGQGQTAVVAGFLAAQASPAGDYAIARQFLTGEAARTWSPHSGIVVYSPESEHVMQPRPQDQSVQVELSVVGQVDRTGRYVARTRPPRSEFYSLARISGSWRISKVPDGIGLQLTQLDLFRIFAPRSVYYLATQQRPGDPRHLVPDRVFLPSGPRVDTTALVHRLFQAPTTSLQDSVEASSRALAATSVQRSREGVVTVRLTDDAEGMGAADLRDLSARLVWTLRADPTFTALRVVTSHGVLRRPGVPDVQPRTSWESYDPEALGESPPYYFISHRRLQAAGTTLVTSSLTNGHVPVDAIAVSPRGDRVAALHISGGTVDVHLGSTRSAAVSTVAHAPGLGSPTWGSGEVGLWLVQGGSSVVRIDPRRPGLLPVAFPGRPPGRIASLALSRDGARAALVIAGRVYVCRVTLAGGVASLVDPVLLPTVEGPVTQVAWSTPTEVVVLMPNQGARAILRIAVDGSSRSPVLTGLIPTAIAAAGPMLVVASDEGALYSVSQGITKVQPSGARPTFAG